MLGLSNRVTFITRCNRCLAWITASALSVFVDGCASTTVLSPSTYNVPPAASPLWKPPLGTVFVSTAGSSADGFDFAEPRYKRWFSPYYFYQSTVPIGVASNATVFAASDSPGGNLWSFSGPYYNRSRIIDSSVDYATAMAVDKTDNVFLAQGKGDSALVRVYRAPRYKPGEWLGKTGRLISTGDLVALPSGDIAVASTSVKPSGKGSVDVFVPKGSSFVDHVIAAISHPRALAASRNGELIVAWCSPCYNKEVDSIGISKPPYSRVNEAIAKSNRIVVLGLAYDSSRKTIFACEQRASGGTVIVRYTYPYHSAKSLSQTQGCYEAFGVSPDGDLIFVAPDAYYGYNIFLLVPPYGGHAKFLEPSYSLPESVVFAK